MATEHAGLVDDPHFWVLLATVIFAVIAWKKGRAPLLAMLDGRTNRIRAELDEAERLKEEAQELLADCQKKHRDAVQSAQKIIDNAKDTAVHLQKDAVRRLEEALKRKETQLTERIARAEASAIQDIRNQAADIAAVTAEKILGETLAKRGGKLVDDAIAELPGRLS